MFTSGKGPACRFFNVENVRGARLTPGSGRASGGGHAPQSSILPGESHGQGSLAGYSPYGCKESDMTKGT